MSNVPYFIGVALALALAGYYTYLRWEADKWKRPYKNPVKTQGTVTDIVALQGRQYETALGATGVGTLTSKTRKFHPVVRFQLQGAQGVKFRSQEGFVGESPYKVGDIVTVEYEKENPLMARISKK